MNNFSIRDIARLSGIKPHTLRIWERRYNFLNPSRSDSNIRKYTNEELKNILNIALLNKHGFKISLLDSMDADEINKNILLLDTAGAQNEKIFTNLVQQMLDMDYRKMEQTLDRCISDRGLTKTIIEIIFPFLDKIGILWTTSKIIPAQEHIVTALIRQKIIVGIDSLPYPVNPQKNILLFLPAGEYHETGLLVLHYVLRKNNIEVIYLGPNVPLDDVALIAVAQQPDFVQMHLTAPSRSFDLNFYIKELSQKIKSIPILASGALVAEQKSIKSKVEYIKSFDEMQNRIAALATG